MLQYTYEFQSGNATGSTEKHRSLLGKTALLRQTAELQSGQPWPNSQQVILVQQLQIDTRTELDAEVHNWIDSAPAGQKLEICFRSIRVVWKSDRTFVQAPDSYVQEALDAVLDYALLAHEIQHLETQAQLLGDTLLQYLAHRESKQHIPLLRAHLNQATQLSLKLMDIRPYCELPARTGHVSTATRLRTELLTQAQTSDGLDLVEHRLELVLDGFEAQLQRTQEFWRGALETWIGISILVLLVLEYLA